MTNATEENTPIHLQGGDYADVNDTKELQQNDNNLDVDLSPLDDVKNKLQDGANSLLTRMPALSSTAATFVILFGLSLAFLGERLLKPLATGSGFVVGFVGGSKLLYAIPEKVFSFGKQREWIILGISLLAGTLTAWLFWKLLKIAIFVLGAASGYFLGMLLVNVGTIWVHIPGKQYVVVASATIAAVLSMMFQKTLTRIVTSIVGSNITFLALDVFLKTGLLQRYNSLLSNGTMDRLNRKCFIMLCGMLILFAISLFVQIRIRKRRPLINSEAK